MADADLAIINLVVRLLLRADLSILWSAYSCELIYQSCKYFIAFNITCSCSLSF
jgi:hypothetical protein